MSTQPKRVDLGEYPTVAYDYPDRLKWRERNGITRDKLAELFGIKVGILIHYETTRRVLDRTLIDRIKDLGVVWL